jgi:hypothetical protein
MKTQFLDEAEIIYIHIQEAMADDDDEMAHRYEDALARLAIDAVLANDKNYKQICKMSASVRSFEFARWCA